jgi:hypothetical protein
LLKQQVLSLEELNTLYVQADSLQKLEVEKLKEEISSNEKKLKKLKSIQKGIIIGSSVGGIVLFIIGLLI